MPLGGLVRCALRTARVIGVAAIACGPLAQVASSAALPPPQYGDSNYKYLVVTFDTLPGFEQPDFDDSQWNDGSAPFGSFGDRCPLDATENTLWNVGNDLLVRRTFELPNGPVRVRVRATVDDDLQVFVNGVDVSGGVQSHDACAVHDTFVFDVPGTVLHPGTNLLAARGRDQPFGEDFLDLQVDVRLETQPPNSQPLPR